VKGSYLGLIKGIIRQGRRKRTQKVEFLEGVNCLEKGSFRFILSGQAICIFFKTFPSVYFGGVGN
jgi:hypothetical protein